MKSNEIRRARLRIWTEAHAIPQKEKSYFSQLLGGASFGEKAARRLERDYGMGDGYLDMPLREDERAESDAHVNPAITDLKQSLSFDSKFSDIRKLKERELPTPTEDEFAFVPQLDMAAACGEGRFQDHVVVKGGLAFKRSSLRDFGVPEHSARIIYAAGGSMAPTIQDGCVVLVNTADTTPIDGKVYLICKPDDGLVLKRLVRDYHPSIGAQAWIMRSDNPDKISHPDKILPPDDRTMIAGRAVWNDNRL
jgi:phage repressor protein C with HTH and peptisase S24 domain